MADESFRYCAYCEEIPGQETQAVRFRGRAALLNSSHWGPHRNLSVGFMGGEPAIRAEVATIAREWEDAAPGGLRFSFWLDTNIDPRSADIRVGFILGRGSWSYLGTVALGIARDQPTMNFGWLSDTLPEDEFRCVVLHEFGHALGLIHEHQNPHDPINWNIAAVSADLSGPPNNWSEDTIRENMFRRYEVGDLFATDVDATSIMMYPIPPNWTNDGFTVRFNSELSANDRALIGAAYPSIGI